MGLDISVYANVKFVAEYVAGEWLEDCEIFVSPEYENTFPGRALPLRVGWYTGERVFGFRAGGYSFYNEWRNLLAKAAGYPSDSYVWRNVPEGPFVELINFYDNEGVLGASVCRKLYSDFCRPGVVQCAKEVLSVSANQMQMEYFEERYNNFKKAFELAGEHNGAVVFH